MQRGAIMDFLEHLPLSPSEKSKLRSLGASGPAALLGMIQASPEGFRNFFGESRTAHLMTLLGKHLGEEDRQALSRPVSLRPVQEAEFTEKPAPPLRPTTYDLSERDRLFEHLERLRAEPNPSKETRQQIAAFEAKLNAMLD